MNCPITLGHALQARDLYESMPPKLAEGSVPIKHGFIEWLESHGVHDYPTQALIYLHFIRIDVTDMQEYFGDREHKDLPIGSFAVAVSGLQNFWSQLDDRAFQD